MTKPDTFTLTPNPTVETLGERVAALERRLGSKQNVSRETDPTYAGNEIAKAIRRGYADFYEKYEEPVNADWLKGLVVNVLKELDSDPNSPSPCVVEEPPKEQPSQTKDWTWAVLSDEVKWSRQFIEELLRHLVGCRDIPRDRLRGLQECYKSGPPSGSNVPDDDNLPPFITAEIHWLRGLVEDLLNRLSFWDPKSDNGLRLRYKEGPPHA